MKKTLYFDYFNIKINYEFKPSVTLPCALNFQGVLHGQPIM